MPMLLCSKKYSSSLINTKQVRKTNLCTYNIILTVTCQLSKVKLITIIVYLSYLSNVLLLNYTRYYLCPSNGVMLKK